MAGHGRPWAGHGRPCLARASHKFRPKIPAQSSGPKFWCTPQLNLHNDFLIHQITSLGVLLFSLEKGQPGRNNCNCPFLFRKGVLNRSILNRRFHFHVAPVWAVSWPPDRAPNRTSGPVFPGFDPGPAQGLTWASLGLDPGQPRSAQAKKLVKKWFLGK